LTHRAPTTILIAASLAFAALFCAGPALGRAGGGENYSTTPPTAGTTDPSHGSDTTGITVSHDMSGEGGGYTVLIAVGFVLLLFGWIFVRHIRIYLRNRVDFTRPPEEITRGISLGESPRNPDDDSLL